MHSCRKNRQTIIALDFDGVLADSLHLKSLAFDAATKGESDAFRNYLKKLHDDNPGVPRTKKFSDAYFKIYKEKIAAESLVNFEQRFADYITANLSQEFGISDSLNYIKDSSSQKFYIVSAAREEEISIFLNRTETLEYIQKVYAYPFKKKDALIDIARTNSISCSDIIFIGDAVKDYQASQAAGTRFFGYNSQTLKELNINYLDSFSQLPSLL